MKWKVDEIAEGMWYEIQRTNRYQRKNS
jgi:hypothetical protein